MRKQCKNPFGSHPEHPASNIRRISRDLVNRAMQFVPHLNVDEPVDLCMDCRIALARQVERAEEAQAAEGLLQGLQDAGILIDPNDDGNSQPPMGEGEDPPFSIEGVDVPQPLGEEGGEHIQINPSMEMEQDQQIQIQETGIVRFLNFGPDAEHLQSETDLPEVSTSTGSSTATTISKASDVHHIRKNFYRSQINKSFEFFGQSPISAEQMRNSNAMKMKIGNFVSSLTEAIQEIVPFPLDVPVLACANCNEQKEAARKDNISILTKREKFMVWTSLNPQFTKVVLRNIGLSEREARKVRKLRAENGPYSYPTFKKTGKSLGFDVQQAVEEWYLDDSNSAQSPRFNDVIWVKEANGTKKQIAKRFIGPSLLQLYNEFKNQHNNHPLMKIGVTKFYLLKPPQCRWTRFGGVHNSCLCVSHENHRLIMLAISQQADFLLAMEDEETITQKENEDLLKQVLTDMDQFISFMICNNPQETCYLGYCQDCPLNLSVETLMKLLQKDSIKCSQWNSSGMGVALQIFNESPEQFETRLRRSTQKIITHQFIYRRQRDFIKELRTNKIKDGITATITVDFGQNYSIIVQRAVQGFHWMNVQATIHPFVAYLYDEVKAKIIYKCYFVVSDTLTHDATSFHAFRAAFIARFTVEFPQIRHLHYVSDGTASQYKNIKNILNLSHHEEEFQLTAAWSFTATAHGKSTCDAYSAIVKRFVRTKSLKGAEITTPYQVFLTAQDGLSRDDTLQFIFVPQSEVEQTATDLQERYALATTVPGSRKIHHLEIVSKNVIKWKEYSGSEESKVHKLFADDIAENQEISDQELEGDNSTNITAYGIGVYLVVKVANTWQVGMVVKIENNNEHRLQMMKRNRTSLYWPTDEKIENFDSDDILFAVQVPTTETGRLYNLTREEMGKLGNSSLK